MAILNQTFRISGVTPILMHCGQTADPLNNFARSMKRLSGKRNKTDEDHEEMSRLEWWAGLYLNEAPEIAGSSSVKLAPDSALVLPAHLLDSCIREGARKGKMGKQASAGCIVDGDGCFQTDTDDIMAMSVSPRYTHRAAVKVGTSKVMRTRPIFHDWQCTFSVSVDTSVIEVEQILMALDAAGKLVGVGDWRPGAPRGGSFGRFQAEAVR